MPSALSEIWWSANSDSAITYRQRVGLFTRPSVGVVVQLLVDPETAGVMFTQNPITGADERVIEASWGLGEAVVAGRVIPDHFRVDRSGAILERVAGRKSIVFRSLSDGGTVEEEVPADRVERLCLDDRELGELAGLADRCTESTGRPGTSSGRSPAGPSTCSSAAPYAAAHDAPARAGRRACHAALAARRRRPRGSAEPRGDELERIASVFKERRFAAGRDRDPAGLGRRGVLRDRLREAWRSSTAASSACCGRRPLGEMRPDRRGTRGIATVTAASDLVCSGVTSGTSARWSRHNGVIGWKLLQSLVRIYRSDREQ